MNLILNWQNYVVFKAMVFFWRKKGYFWRKKIVYRKKGKMVNFGERRLVNK
jgi:hypothetical protein